jgi:hypothetical protein
MILGHVFGIPVEETAVQLAPAGAATVAVIAIAGRTKFGQLQRRFRRRMRIHRGGLRRPPPEQLNVVSLWLVARSPRARYW